jgi:hypothetical protein
MSAMRVDCRNRLSPGDYDFVAQVVSAGSKPSESLFRLLQDSETFDAMLDDNRLFRAVVDTRGYLNISLHLYFYVLVRHALRQEGVEDRNQAGYIASLLADFAASGRWRHSDPDSGASLDYLHELMDAALKAQGSLRFQMQLHVGDYALFVSGLFPAHVRHRVQRRAAPGLEFFEALGQSHYRLAGEHSLAKLMGASTLLFGLCQVFHTVRLALNRLSEEWVCLDALPEAEGLVKGIELQNKRLDTPFDH